MPKWILNQLYFIFYLGIKNVHVNITKKNETKNGHLNETKDYLGPLMDDGGTIFGWLESIVVHNSVEMNLKEELFGSIYRCGLEEPLPRYSTSVLFCYA